MTHFLERLAQRSGAAADSKIRPRSAPTWWMPNVGGGQLPVENVEAATPDHADADAVPRKPEREPTAAETARPAENPEPRSRLELKRSPGDPSLDKNSRKPQLQPTERPAPPALEISAVEPPSPHRPSPPPDSDRPRRATAPALPDPATHLELRPNRHAPSSADAAASQHPEDPQHTGRQGRILQKEVPRVLEVSVKQASRLPTAASPRFKPKLEAFVSEAVRSRLQDRAGASQTPIEVHIDRIEVQMPEARHARPQPSPQAPEQPFESYALDRLNRRRKWY